MTDREPLPPPEPARAPTGGWHADPIGRYELRFHNGTDWTADVATAGERYVDPLGTDPEPPSVEAAGRNRHASLALGFGIASIALGWLPYVFVAGAAAAALAIGFGISGRRRAGAVGAGRSKATTGLATGIAGALLCIAGLLFTIVFVDALDRYDNPAPHEIALVACEHNGRVAEARGEITNLGGDGADFTFDIEFVRAGTDNVHRTERVEVNDVDAGETREFEASRSVSLDEVDCLLSDVRGPLPFGVDVGW